MIKAVATPCRRMLYCPYHTSLTEGNTTQGKEITLDNQRVFIHNNASVTWAAIDGKK